MVEQRLVLYVPLVVIIITRRCTQSRTCRPKAILYLLSRVSTAMLTHDIDTEILSVCPSVCLSRCGIVSTWLNISSYFIPRMVA